MSTQTFGAVFQDRLDKLKARAAAAGTNVTELCKRTGTARATPDRWEKEAPKTIQIMDQLEAELAKIEQTANK